jgi:hypothetical protein
VVIWNKRAWTRIVGVHNNALRVVENLPTASPTSVELDLLTLAETMVSSRNSLPLVGPPIQAARTIPDPIFSRGISILLGVALDVAEEVQPLRVFEAVLGLGDRVFGGESAEVRGVVSIECIVSSVLMRGVVEGRDKPVAIFGLQRPRSRRERPILARPPDASFRVSLRNQPDAKRAASL